MNIVVWYYPPDDVLEVTDVLSAPPGSTDEQLELIYVNWLKDCGYEGDPELAETGWKRMEP